MGLGSLLSPLVSIAFLALGVTACASAGGTAGVFDIGSVWYKHPTTGDVKECGGGFYPGVQIRRYNCGQKYLEQGYVEVENCGQVPQGELCISNAEKRSVVSGQRIRLSPRVRSGAAACCEPRDAVPPRHRGPAWAERELNMTRVPALLLGWLILTTAGCATGPRADRYPPIQMRNPRTSEVAICRAPGEDDYFRQRDCVSDFQRQGWERVPD
jgi:hypothetical protein